VHVNLPKRLPAKIRRFPTVAGVRATHKWLNDPSDGPHTMLLLGIKDLKQINNQLGHGAGDAVIRTVAARLRAFAAQQLSPVSLMARLSGREFLLVIKGNTRGKHTELAAQKLLEMVSVGLGEPDAALHVNARVAIAMSRSGETRQQVVARAMHALAQAYARKGRRFVIAGDDVVAAGADHQMLDVVMRSALAERQIIIVLQPQFEVATGNLVGAEALARLRHPLLGEIGAGALFASADRCDLREELSHHIQHEAIAIAAAWPTELRHLRLAVNLGAEELTDHYGPKLLELLARTGFNADRLTLELTEESLVRDLQLAAGQLELLRRNGVRIAVDDFGTGYSSLAYLKALPVDYLKIDKGMTPDISGGGKDRIILRAIIAMAKALDLLIIAEGVEREEELAMLKAEDCDYFQGFLRAPPLTPEAFTGFALQNA
jgi:diguanylate cyclase (GGDEF)-like protein